MTFGLGKVILCYKKDVFIDFGAAEKAKERRENRLVPYLI